MGELVARIAELGGKSAIVIDSDADLDEAVPVAVRSVFGFGGQHRSAACRIVAVGAVHDLFLERFVEAARSLANGPPAEKGTELGPVIDEDSVKRIRAWQDRAEHLGAAVLRARDFEHALELANQTGSALTAGIMSRSPSHFERASAILKGANIYVNRAISGAVVAPKAGGLDYLFQFVHPPRPGRTRRGRA